ncbi:MAG: zinc ribbon domain-containing protein, partial [Anaerolineales bacterium]|nr:zinc ribbon domain-containing protein [Anaerolineales bacterium]
MADIRCPMCSKSNPEDAEVCGVCGARLKPLVIDQPPQEQPPGQAEEPRTEQGAEQEEGLDWLGRIRTEAESEVPDDEIEPEETTDEAVSPDWLGRLREVDITADEGPPDGEVPDWLSAFSEDVGEVREPEGEEQEWLDRIREKKETEAIESEEEAEPVD